MFEALIPWYEAHKRELPWRQDKEPYHVWLSEIMLQQTRVEAVKEYYRRFLTALPTMGCPKDAAEGCRNRCYCRGDYRSEYSQAIYGGSDIVSRIR